MITNIDLDHQQWLGDTIEQIASEKAGIIKRGVPVITAASPDKGLPIIAGIAREHKATLRIVDCNAAEATPGGSMKLSLAGSFQRINAALALATVDVLQGVIEVPEEARVTGLATVQWPGRMQRLITAAGQEVLIDGAHNPGGNRGAARGDSMAFPGGEADDNFWGVARQGLHDHDAAAGATGATAGANPGKE